MPKTRSSKRSETAKRDKNKSTLGVAKTSRTAVSKAKNVVNRKGAQLKKNGARNARKKSTVQSKHKNKSVLETKRKSVAPAIKKKGVAPTIKKNASGKIMDTTETNKKGKKTKNNDHLTGSNKKNDEVLNQKELPSVYQFKISLLDTNPLIWRRIQVPMGYSFYNFHIAIVESMGWTGVHHHAFYINDPRKKEMVYISSSSRFGSKKESIDEKREKINKYFPKKTEIAEYEYDIADSWRHEILFEGKVPRKQGGHYPQCIDGEQACPPEESGGVEAYSGFCKIIKNPKHPEYKDMKSWLENMGHKNFNPNKFDPKKVHMYRPGGFIWVQM